MASGNLENLVKTNQLKAEAVDRKEFDGLVRSGRARLTDARRSDLSYLGYVLFVRGTVAGEGREFSVGIGKSA